MNGVSVFDSWSAFIYLTHGSFIMPVQRMGTGLRGSVSGGDEPGGGVGRRTPLPAAQDFDGSVGWGLSPVGANTRPSSVTGGTAPGTPMRVSLRRLLEETDGGDGERETGEKDEKGRVGSDSVCCVCMWRSKGAALIPCGHTFCRVCSRELWLNRGSCPLCNRSIIEILDIF
ncbi:RING/U-box superfamily protein [Actinidia rufa]|uniref:RING/U-box superfamily protein n=1 Tax=Actinidia rufa TaxID=165716 RepID=A0A7J0EZ39_9ERIC|nr:RING/U-box superfamily protein [Actinidia rufa]